jgi:hypothetical protein
VNGWQDLHLVAGYLLTPTVQLDRLFRNSSDGTFTDVSWSSGLAGSSDEADMGRTSAYADYDRGGFVDILVTHYGGPLRLYRNASRTQGNTNHWLVVELNQRINGLWSPRSNVARERPAEAP